MLLVVLTSSCCSKTWWSLATFWGHRQLICFVALIVQDPGNVWWNEGGRRAHLCTLNDARRSLTGSTLIVRRILVGTVCSSTPRNLFTCLQISLGGQWYLDHSYVAKDWLTYLVHSARIGICVEVPLFIEAAYDRVTMAVMMPSWRTLVSSESVVCFLGFRLREGWAECVWIRAAV